MTIMVKCKMYTHLTSDLLFSWAVTCGHPKRGAQKHVSAKLGLKLAKSRLSVWDL